MTLLDYERAGIAGASQQRTTIAELAEAVANDERSRKELVRNDVTDRAIETEVGYNLSLRIASMQARGLIPNYEASMGKMFSSELSQRIARTGTKAFGLYGNLWSLTDEYTPLRARHTHAYFRTIPSTIAGGSSEIQRNIIATRGLGLPRG
jgi:alkylation response protein AidB-like acyl-CoA dehydrogenase